MFSKDIGIDLGTANVLIYIKNQGIVLNEPSIVAIEKDTKKVVATGKEASIMLGRTPGKIKAIKPMKDGVIADLEITQIMLSEFIKKIKLNNIFTKPRILICCPSNITQVEKNTLREAAEEMGARKVYIEEESKVAAIGAGLDINEAKANMIVDIGGGTTDIAILSLGDIVLSDSIKIAGNTLDKDIINYIKEKYKLLIGEKTAENIKINFSNILDPDKKIKLEVRGRNLITGLPDIIEINQLETKEALQKSIDQIKKSIVSILEKTPPELSGDIVDKGIVLTGGGSLLTGLSEILEEEIKVPVIIATDPLLCVAEGAGKLLEENNFKNND